MKTGFQKAVLFSLASMLCASAYAVKPGFYMGMMFGPATNTGGDRQAQLQGPPAATTTVSPRSTQYGTSIFMGYKNNEYIGSEYGFTYYSGIDYDTKDQNTCSSTDTRVRDLHALLRGAFPIGESFEVFGKAGVAYTYQTTSGALNPDLTSSCGKTTQTGKASPSFALGASYGLSQNWISDVSLNRLMVGGAAGSMDWFALGISYHFVDKFCGQFLC